ncbi:hypothetical protein F5148DRAFT_184379 [Russula earlei]|uniref:Uncharacterized protein n=1 Tax=Russula earlei TaxID=71964 RepID=A0ACC0UK44_9AGAM|nr:hypothetical protein F5148DRAFT_184379 [Russula earlei]
MSQDQDPRYRSGYYQAHPSGPPQQSGQFVSRLPMTQDGYPNRPNQHAYQFPQGSPPLQPSGSSTSGSYPPYGESHMSFPEPHPESSFPQRSSSGHTATYFSPPPTIPDPSIPPHHYVRRDTGGSSYGARQDPSDYPPSDRSSGGHRAHPAGGSDTGGSDMYSGAQSSQFQNWNTSGYDEGRDEGHDDDQYQRKGPRSPPAAGYSMQCT